MDILQDNPDVVLTFTGVKTTNGMPVYDNKGNPIIAKVIGVIEKKDPRKIDQKNMIPKKIGIMPTDVIQVGKIKKLELDQTIEPLIAGYSIGHKNITAGTIGLICHGNEGGPKIYSVPISSKKELNFGFLDWLLKFFRWLFGQDEQPDPPEPDDDSDENEDDDEDEDEDEDETGCPEIPNELDCADCEDWVIGQGCWWNIDCPEIPNEKDCIKCGSWINDHCEFDEIEDPVNSDKPEEPNDRPIHPNVYILSNNHVLANEDNCFLGDSIYQCGPYDSNSQNQNRIIGKLVSYVPIETQEPFTVDAAICSIYADIPYEKKIAQLPYYKTTTACVKIGDKVHKVGRTTEHTTDGEVLGLDGESWVEYNRMRLLSDQIVIQGYKFSLGGDSGSIILNENNEIVGLLCAGSDEITLANKIENVCKKLNIKF